MKKYVCLLSLFLCLLLCGCATKQDTSHEAFTPTKHVAAAKINTRLGLAYLERQQIDRAKQKFLLALKQAPAIPETWYSMAYFLEATGDKNEADKYYRKAIAIAPKRGDALNNYGTFLCRDGQYSRAITYFKRAADDPDYLNSSAAYENAGLCAQGSHNRADAIRYFNKALNQDSQRTRSILSLANLYYQDAKYGKARSLMATYNAISKPTKESRQLMAMLKKHRQHA